MPTDPVCRSELDELDAMQVDLTTEYNGRVYHFCSNACKKRFDHEPAAFASRFDDWEEWDIPDHIWKDA